MGWSCSWVLCSVVRNFRRSPLIWRIFWAYLWTVSVAGCHFDGREWTGFRNEFKRRIELGNLCLYTVQMPVPCRIYLTVCVCVCVCVCVTENTKDFNARISEYNLKYWINFYFCISIIIIIIIILYFIFYYEELITYIQMRTALSWIITRGVVVLYYRRFGTIYRSLNPEDGTDK